MNQKFFNRYHLYALFLCILSSTFFIKILEDVVQKEALVDIDLYINQQMGLIQEPWLNQIMTVISLVADPLPLTIFSLLLFLFLRKSRQNYPALLLLCSMLGGLLVESLTKITIHRLRPTNALINVPGYSFPSAHATMATIFFSLIIYVFSKKIESKVGKFLFIIFNLALFLVIGFSRIYLNVHWFSDVLAGFSLGLFWLSFLVLVFKLGKIKVSLKGI